MFTQLITFYKKNITFLEKNIKLYIFTKKKKSQIFYRKKTGKKREKKREKNRRRKKNRKSNPSKLNPDFHLPLFPVAHMTLSYFENKVFHIFLCIFLW